MSLLADVWTLLTPRQRRRVLGAQALSLLMACSTVAGIASIAPFFSVLGNLRLIEHNRWLHALYDQLGFSSSRGFVVALGLGFVALALLANLINLLGVSAMSHLAWRIGVDLQSSLFAEYLRRPYQFHATTHSSVLVNNIIHEAARTTLEILESGLLLVTNITTAALIVLSTLLLNPVIAAPMIVALAGGYALIYSAVRGRLLHYGRIQSELVREETKIVDESLGAIKEVLILRAQNFFRRRFEHASQSVALAVTRTQQVSQSSRHIMECVAVAGLVGLALVLSGRDQGIGGGLGQLTFVGFAAYRLLPTLQQVFVAVVKMRAAAAGFASIAPDLRMARGRKAVVVAADSALQECPRREIVLRDVSFRYAPDRPLAVERVSAHIPAKTAVGLVGTNGSGKTTLVDLIAGLLVPESGAVEVDGVALNDTNRASWGARIAYVPQDIFLLDTSIAENVALGTPAAAIDRQRLLAVAQLAKLDEFVLTLPNGYDHLVGERGVRLSGGQRQRIGIARALYTEASVLILDEATSAQDGEAEQELIATLGRLRGRYTIILIAHRLSTLQACDSIFEIRRGQIVATGTYAELLSKSEGFRRMAEVC